MLSISSKEDLTKLVADRHYYLRIARQHLMISQIGEMHIYCSLAENTQTKIEKLASNEDLSFTRQQFSFNRK